MATTDEATRAGVSAPAVLASFVAPGRAARLAQDLDAGPDDRDGVAAAVALLRQRYGATDGALVVALDAAGAPASRIAQLVGLEPVEVHAVLDDELAATPDVAARATVPLGLTIARGLVRAIWVVLAVAVVVVVVQARGGVLPCTDELCIDWVDVALDDGTAVAATTRSVFTPGEVEAVRFRHRAPETWTGTVRWTADGEEVLVSRVSLEGSGLLTVDWPQARLPTGVHVVTLVDGPPGATVTFSVERP